MIVHLGSWPFADVNRLIARSQLLTSGHEQLPTLLSESRMSASQCSSPGER